MAPPDTRIVLVRHGQAQTFLDQTIGGHKGCTGLSDLGRRQAEALRDRLARTGELAGATALYASVLPRAIETAEIIAPALGGLEVHTDCDLCELHSGDDIDGMTWAEADARAAEWRNGRDFDPFHPWSPEAESWAEFASRVGRRLHRLAHDHPGETVVVACHGGVIDSSFRALGHVPIQHRINHDPENTSLTEWVVVGDGWRLARFNDTGHLQDV